MGGVNPIRAVIQTLETSFVSPETDVQVGITILLAAQGNLITVAALIDDRLVQGYDFEVQVRLPRLGVGVEPIIIRKSVVAGKVNLQLDDPASVDWASLQAIYLGPDDPRIVRTELIVDDELKARSNEIVGRSKERAH